MPVTKSRNGMNEMLSLDQTNTTRFLFGDEEGTPDVNHYLEVSGAENNFPTLVRHENYPGQVGLTRSAERAFADPPPQLSVSHAALDLARSPSTGPESNGWGAISRHRSSQSQQSLPPLHTLQSPVNGQTAGNSSNPPESPINARSSYRNSLDAKSFYEETSQVASPKNNATPPKLQSSYSANDVPTMRSTTNGAPSSITTTPNSHAQQHLHNHNASLGRIPPSAMNNRLSREVPNPEPATTRENQTGGFPSIQSALHASAPPFGPSLNQPSLTIQPSLAQTMSQAPLQPTMTSPSAQQAYPVQGFYGNYGMQQMMMGMQGMTLGQQGYSPHNPYAPQTYGAPAVMYPQSNGPRDSQARVIQQRRQNDGEGMSLRFLFLFSLETCLGHLSDLDGSPFDLLHLFSPSMSLFHHIMENSIARVRFLSWKWSVHAIFLHIPLAALSFDPTITDPLQL